MNEQSRKRPHNAAPIVGSPHSDPGIPSLSTSPTSYFIERTMSMNYLDEDLTHSSELDRSVSNFSEIEVVLDDGSTQKRTVSLSTLYDEERLDDTQRIVNTQILDKKDAATPLLKTYKNSYQTINEQPDEEESSSSYSSSIMTSSSDDDSDSDEPFFPIQKTGTKKHFQKNPYLIQEEENGKRYWTRFRNYVTRSFAACTFSPRQRLVLKCSFAYFLGSLFTFVPQLNALIGNNHVSSHLAATATVFFNPAKTLGGMVEAAAYGWGYVLFAVFICLGSMMTTDFFVDRDMSLVAHLISLLFWLSGATFIVSFLKAHWNLPAVGTASSLCFITIFVIVVREGSINLGDFDTTRIEQITVAVATGTLITVACCIIFWPVSATKQLKKDLDATLNSYRVLLKLLTKTFLLDDDLPEFKANSVLQAAIQSHQASFTALQKSLKEAKLESFWNRQVRGREAEYDAIITSMQRLAQHMGGLRSSCGIQFEIMGSETTKKYKQQSRERKRMKRRPNPFMSSRILTKADELQSRLLKPGLGESLKSKISSSFDPVSPLDSANWNVKAGYRRRKLQDEMRKQKTMQHSFEISEDEEERGESNLSSASKIWAQQVTSQLKTLAQAESTNSSHEGTSLINFIQTIRPPLKSFAYTCKQTIYHLQTYFSASDLRDKWIPKSRRSRKTPTLKVLRANLQKAICLFEAAQTNAIQKLYRSRIHDISQHHNKPSEIESEAVGSILGEDVILVYFFVFNMTEFARELITLVESVDKLYSKKEKVGLTSWLWSKIKGRGTAQTHKKEHASFVPNERHMVDTLHTPIPKTAWRRFFIKVWMTFSLFKLQKIRYAIKSTIAVIILASPAFYEPTKEFFRTYRMEWALITLMVVMTPTVGGTNLVAIYRIFSTILGCYTAMVFYMLFPGNWYILSILTWLFSIPNFYLILNNKHGKFGQFTLLAYNLVMLNKYNDRDTNEVAVWVLATQRCFAILVGVVFGLMVTAYVWPFEARVELRKGLSDFLLRLAWLYQKLVSIYADDPSSIETTTQSFMEHELGLQRALIDLQSLLSQTPNEPRLKGAFPVDTYRTMLTSCQNIVDRLVSMRTVVLKDANETERRFMMVVAHERKEMVGNIILYFYLLASALRLKTPMPPYFPPARKAWKSLLEKLCDLPVDKSKKLVEKDNMYVFYYAYVTLMEDVVRELDKLGENMTRLFGSLVPKNQWESLFDEEQQRLNH